jgi:hypothetical protein
MRKRMIKKGGRIAVAFAAALLVAGGAFAYFASDGSGSGNGTVGSPDAVTIAARTPQAQLFPRGSGDVVATISNSNSFPVRVSSLVLDEQAGDAGFAVDGDHADCHDPALSFTADSTGWTVPGAVGSDPGTLDVTLAGAVTMGAAADDACQGATFTVYLKAGA